VGALKCLANFVEPFDVLPFLLPVSLQPGLFTCAALLREMFCFRFNGGLRIIVLYFRKKKL
jgi:hypothetical protein